VCTENLTPWSKLLPCGQKVGLGSLYDAINLFDSLYFSLSLKVVPVCQDSDCLSVGTSVYQTLSVVIKPADVSRE
jgi:phosphatidylinositol glycan class T